ncbi:MAG: hypothetical protein IKS44_04750, partial [Bacteroidales bacterium]|nr:hypothetical protein [Bacteroidales bacterium]
FASGAAASLISGAVGGVCDLKNVPAVWTKTAMIAAGGLGGGVSSLIAGGEFIDGLCNGLICAGLNHALHYVAKGVTGPDDPPRQNKNNTAEKIQNATNKSGAGLTLVGGALKMTGETTGGLTGLLKLSSRICNTFTGIAIGTNFVINGKSYYNGEIDLYSMFTRDAMTMVEFGISKIPYGIGVIPSIALTAYDIGGGFEQTLYNSAWAKTQIYNLDQHLYQYRPDPGYQPVYYRHGK